jgi:hypothetical protein
MSGERTRLACWFESLAVASRPLQRRLAETNLVFVSVRSGEIANYRKVRDR